MPYARVQYEYRYIFDPNNHLLPRIRIMSRHNNPKLINKNYCMIIYLTGLSAGSVRAGFDVLMHNNISEIIAYYTVTMSSVRISVCHQMET